MLQPPSILNDLLPASYWTWVKGGTFIRSYTSQRNPRETRSQTVRLDSFFMGKFPVTQSLWVAVNDRLGQVPNPSHFIGPDRPVEYVSWKEAKSFIENMNQIEGFTLDNGPCFRLPTEAEWEFAARGGEYNGSFLFAGGDHLDELGWFEENSSGSTHNVGQKRPNELGLYDLTGNVWEWCEDVYDPDGYEIQSGMDEIHNPKGPPSGLGRVFRGGSWLSGQKECELIRRGYDRTVFRSNLVGFRCVWVP